MAKVKMSFFVTWQCRQGVDMETKFKSAKKAAMFEPDNMKFIDKVMVTARINKQFQFIGEWSHSEFEDIWQVFSKK